MRLHLKIKITTPPNAKQKEYRILNRLVDNISSLAVLLQLTVVCFLWAQKKKKAKLMCLCLCVCLCMEGSKLGRHSTSHFRTVWKFKCTLQDTGAGKGEDCQSRFSKTVLYLRSRTRLLLPQVGYNFFLF